MTALSIPDFDGRSYGFIPLMGHGGAPFKKHRIFDLVLSSSPATPASIGRAGVAVLLDGHSNQLV